MLSWQQGDLPLETEAPEFANDGDSYASAYLNEMPSRNYGLYVCTNESGVFVENYIHDSKQRWCILACFSTRVMPTFPRYTY